MRLAACLLAAALDSAGATEPPRGRFGEAIEVRRVLLDVRVLARDGSALQGLGPGDFALRVDGRPVTVEAVEWSGSPERPEGPGAATEPATSPDAVAPAPQPLPRLVVLLFQLDLHPSRVSGLLRMAPLAAKLLASLAPEDHVAVLSFRSHLRLHVDFTNDRERLARAVEPLALLAEPPPVAPGAAPSLAIGLDPAEAHAAANPEKALLLIARALRELPGSKTVALLGWGMGELSRDRVHLHADYPEARRTLVAAHATVVSLDLTNADYHSLEVGLQAVAEDTGGFYARTHLFPAAAIRRLGGALEGSYVLVFDLPSGGRGPHRVDLRLPGHPQATVYTRQELED